MLLLNEAVFQDSSLPQRIDKDAGIIRKVKVLGIESANGRTYPLAVMRDALPLYQDVKVNIDHAYQEGAERSYTSGFGLLRNPLVENDGMYADLHYNREHPNAKQVLEDCERFPNNFGLSHNAEGEVNVEGGKQIVESLAFVGSVDVVGEPATNTGIWESKKRGSKLVMKKTVKRIIEDAPKGTKGIVGLREQVEEGLLDPETIVDVPVAAEGGEVAASGGAEGEVKAALKTAVSAAFDDPNLDLTATLNAIKTILKAHEDIVGPVGETTASTASDESGTASGESDSIAGDKTNDDKTGTDEKVKESLQRKLAATTMLAEAGIKITDARIKVLSSADLSNAEMKELTESWKAPQTEEFAGRPANSKRKFSNDAGSFRESVKEAGGFAKAMKR